MPTTGSSRRWRTVSAATTCCTARCHPKTHALSHWCWNPCERDSLAATSYAIEGVTGDWSALVCSKDIYEQSFPTDVRARAMKWLKLHAKYDDTHPWEALEIICALMGANPTPRGVALIGSRVVTAEDVHLVIVATFSVAAAGIQNIVELSLMPVTRYWLPAEDAFEKQLIERLVANGRSFVKGLRYNLDAESAVASATLTDCEGSPPLLFVANAGIEDSGRYLPLCDPSVPMWLWNPSSEAMPALPPRRQPYLRAVEPAVECR